MTTPSECPKTEEPVIIKAKIAHTANNSPVKGEFLHAFNNREQAQRASAAYAAGCMGNIVFGVVCGTDVTRRHQSDAGSSENNDKNEYSAGLTAFVAQPTVVCPEHQYDTRYCNPERCDLAPMIVPHEATAAELSTDCGYEAQRVRMAYDPEETIVKISVMIGGGAASSTVGARVFGGKLITLYDENRSSYDLMTGDVQKLPFVSGYRWLPEEGDLIAIVIEPYAYPTPVDRPDGTVELVYDDDALPVVRGWFVSSHQFLNMHIAFTETQRPAGKIARETFLYELMRGNTLSTNVARRAFRGTLNAGGSIKDALDAATPYMGTIPITEIVDLEYSHCYNVIIMIFLFGYLPTRHFVPGMAAGWTIPPMNNWDLPAGYVYNLLKFWTPGRFDDLLYEFKVSGATGEIPVGTSFFDYKKMVKTGQISRKIVPTTHDSKRRVGSDSGNNPSNRKHSSKKSKGQQHNTSQHVKKPPQRPTCSSRYGPDAEITIPGTFRACGTCPPVSVEVPDFASAKSFPKLGK